MRRLLGATALFVVVACSPLQALTVLPLSTVSLSVGGVAVDTTGLTITYDSEKQQGTIFGNIQGNDWNLSVDATTTPDPFVLYAIGAVNLTGAPLAFSFSFTTPLLGGPYNQLTNTFNGSMTDLIGDGVTLSGIMQMALLDSSNVPAVQLGTFTCVGGPGLPSSNYACPAGPGFGPVTAAVPSAFYTTLGTNLTFTVSSVDSASFNGDVVLSSVPEPTTAALIGLGLLCLAGFRARSRRP
jgi:hypothetical protein